MGEAEEVGVKTGWERREGKGEMRRDSGSNKGADSEQMSHCH